MAPVALKIDRFNFRLALNVHPLRDSHDNHHLTALDNSFIVMKVNSPLRNILHEKKKESVLPLRAAVVKRG